MGQKEFLDTFRLEKGTLFYEMLEQTYELLEYYLEQDYSPTDEDTFPRDAYEFWLEYYSSKSDSDSSSGPGWYDLPKPWREIAGSASNKYKVMFAVETVQSFLGRLMLAKACEDYDFPNVSISEHIKEETINFRGNIPPIAHIRAGHSLMGQMRNELVESVFEQDIYYWWTQPAEELEGMSSREIVEEDWPSEIENFGLSLVEFTITMSRFDFSTVQGDPLGELYQQYFDPTTRRTLGEFYTPPSLCEYIIDSTGYDEDAQYRRLIDPACGSGTFLMSALDTYLDGVEDEELPSELQDLCNGGHIVGLDIHPFAVVLAQIRFMLEILEEYKKAIEMEPNLVLHRLPIFRTDSLVDESQAPAGNATLETNYADDVVEFTMKLPVRSDSEFEPMDFEFPTFSHVQERTGNEVGERGDYFTALCAVFDAVKDYAEDEEYSIEQADLAPFFYDYFDRVHNVDQISSVFYDTANKFLETVRELREEYNDGRLLKLIEDVVLGAVLKNEMPYDYVVGNPPWVAKQSQQLDDEHDWRMKRLYLSAWKETDPYLQFMERGLGMLREGGTLGFLVSNRYLTNQGGKEIRGLLAKNNIKEIIDFTDYQLFDDATNYSSHITVEKAFDNDDWESFIEDGSFTNQHEISATRVRDWDGNISNLVEKIRSREPTDTIDFFTIDSSRFQDRVWVREDRVATEEYSETFESQQGRIPLTRHLPLADIWPVSPPSEYELIDRIESKMEMRLGDKLVIRNNEPEAAPNLVGDNVRVGVQTSGDGVYVVEPTIGIAKEKLHELNQLTISPKNIDRTYTVETDLLKIDITGEDADRWLPNWSNRLVFIPYIQGEQKAELIEPTSLAEKYPHTWDYFTDINVLETLSEESGERQEIHEELAIKFDIVDEDKLKNTTLDSNDYQELSNILNENPERVDDLEESLWWYRFMYRKNIEILPKPKILTGDLVQYNKLSFDDSGIMAPHNVSVYAILLPEEDRYVIAGVLNSALTEFYHKQHSRVHAGKAYRYIEDHTSQWPVIRPSGEEEAELESLVEDILHLKDLKIKIPQFPDPYIAAAREEGREFTTISYTPSSSYTADPVVQTDLSDEYSIVLDDGVIDDGIIDNRAKAKYVKEALSGTELNSNNSVSVPIPLTDCVAEDALDELVNDQEMIECTSIADLESEIDGIVYDLFDIELDEHREMIRRYNNQFETTQPIEPEFE
ncbi:type i restriction-modification system methyltransferase subunit [Natrialba asiatica DSM 12278]|uniref:site-specific DNA-methyltransferase (adenine-specific) n=1 Tax=Natrialba asiatica (strain ATCC 700177 / DSM 12278 / JCM 9576 / FERM P-10747 / NBRC 102637 / 172P1) TaxID=29540 RepID=M0AR28_NATA1|nr:type i restriction-modification system methyltransferase subunit [Natrialba asiatica DSM 12278]